METLHFSNNSSKSVALVKYKTLIIIDTGIIILTI